MEMWKTSGELMEWRDPSRLFLFLYIFSLKKKVFSIFLGRVLVFLFSWSLSWSSSCFLVFFYKFPPQKSMYTVDIKLFCAGWTICWRRSAARNEKHRVRPKSREDGENLGEIIFALTREIISGSERGDYCLCNFNSPPNVLHN